MPLSVVASKYAALRQELPPESAQLAYECQAFQRARVLESPEELLYLVLLYSIGDLSLREVAGVSTGSGKPLTDEAVRQRLAACQAAGAFHGPLVVSMRPMKPADAIRAIQITTRFPSVHGAPVHIGKPESIGIKDLARPDWGDAVPVHDDELPVFWACGVTPQSVIMAARPDFCITHYPGAMLVTDRRNTEFAIM